MALALDELADRPRRVFEGTGARGDSFRVVDIGDSTVFTGTTIVEIKRDNGWRAISRPSEAKGAAICMARALLKSQVESLPTPLHPEHVSVELAPRTETVKVVATWFEGRTTAFIQTNIPDAMGDDSWFSPRDDEWEMVTHELAAMLTTAGITHD